MSNSLWPHKLQHSRLPCSSLSPAVYSNSSPLSELWHSTILSSVTPFTSCPQSFPVLGSFPASQLFASCGRSIGASASAPVLPVNIQGWFPLTYSISLQSKGLSKVFSSASVHKHQFFGAQPSLWSNSHIHRWLLKKTIASTIWTFVGKVMSLLFNTLSRFFIVFLQGASILSSWLQSLSAVILESKNIKSITVSTFPPFICHEVTDGMSCIHTYFRFLFNIFHYKVFSRAPCAIQWVLISFLFHVICRKQSYGYHGGKGEGR